MKVWRFIKAYWWIFLAVASGIFMLVWRLMVRPGESTGPLSEPMVPPTFADRAREEADRIRLEGEVEKARTTAKADASRAVIDHIEEVGKTDPKEARRQLAGWISQHL